MNEKLVERFRSPGPKRVLSLDGGGIRGVLTLEFLEQIETLLGKRSGRQERFRLCDYFDLIGGTSTGSIIAAMLACGHTVATIKTLYTELAEKVFRKSVLRKGLYVSKFPEKPLEQALQHYLGEETTLGSDTILTGLMVMTKRLDTGSPWPLHNGPSGAYFNPEQCGGSAIANRDFLLSKIVRASTAAPHFFEPERISVARNACGECIDGAFVDGGVSMANNPALQLFMLATLHGYGFRWSQGENNLLLVSVGTGDFSLGLYTDEVMGMPAAGLAVRSLMSLMKDSDALVQTMLQWMGRTLTPWVIDREIGDLGRDRLSGEKQLTYVRYNARFESGWLKDTLGMDMERETCAALEKMDDPKNVSDLAAAGMRAAHVLVRDEHFPATFDTGS
ncbi:MAG: patatin [Chlorobi bacterium]|nr:patatin [Chlorobiota bacterium]